MLKPKDMLKLTLFGPKSYMKQVINVLYELDTVHIEEFTKKKEEELFDIGEPYESNEQYAEVLVKLRSLKAYLNITKPSSSQLDSFIEIKDKTSIIHDKASALLRKKEYYLMLKKIYTKKLLKDSISYLKLDETLDYSDYLHFVGFVLADFNMLESSIKSITSKFVLYTANYEGITVVALFVDDKSKDKINEVLESCQFSPIDNPLIKEHFKLQSNPAKKFVKLDNEINNIEKQLKQIQLELESLNVEHSDFIASAEQYLRKQTDKAEAPLLFATTKNTFTLRGWVPKENKAKLEEKITDITENKVMLKFEKPGKNENVPIAFNHPKIVQPFEAFMNLYTLPSYREIDPTFFMFLTFPFFFGFMLGDVGYGIVTLLLFITLKRKMPNAKNFLNAFIIASIMSIVFGMVFGEVFGYEEVSPAIGAALGIAPKVVEIHGVTEVIYPIPHLFSRSHGINELLSVAVLFGVAHILIGLIIGFINVKRAHGLMHAILEKAGWILLLPIVTWLLIDFLGIIKEPISSMVNVIMPPMPVLIGLSVVGLILILKGEGARGAIELPAILSNILSYARLMAVGLASLSLALVVNDLARQMFSAGILGVFAGIFILILGHTINIALGILSPFLHSLRLHYVEFFNKFFTGGGKKFESFGYKT